MAYFQQSNIFGLAPLSYALLAIGLALLIDRIFDNFVTPRIIAQALRVHPAAVLIAALVFANLIGLLGVVVAAPILATVALIWRYIVRKMLDSIRGRPGSLCRRNRARRKCWPGFGASFVSDRESNPGLLHRLPRQGTARTERRTDVKQSPRSRDPDAGRN